MFDLLSFPRAPGTSRAERQVWADLAALLDPAAYALHSGAAFSVTVPAGETWYAVNLWNTLINGAHTELRVLDSQRSIALPPGTTIASNGNAGAFAYLCKPALVSGGARYADPKGLYFEQVARLRTLPLNVLRRTTTPGDPVGSIYTQLFPSDFTNGFITWVAGFDVAWVVLQTAGGIGLNTLFEISDDHAQRLAEAIWVPFVRTTYDRMAIRGANVLGNINAGDPVFDGGAENGVAVTVTSGGTQITAINLGPVRAGSVVQLTGLANLAKGATGGLTHLRLAKAGGTATLVFGNNEAHVQNQFTHPASATHGFSVAGVGKVTVGGTLSVELRGVSAGSDASVAAGEGELYARVLQSAVLDGWGAITYVKLPADW